MRGNQMDAVQSPAWIRPGSVLVDHPRLLDLHAVELDADAVEVVREDPAHDVLEQRGRNRGREMALRRSTPSATCGSLSAAARNRRRSCATSCCRRATRCSGASFADGDAAIHRQRADGGRRGRCVGVERCRHGDPQLSLERLDVDQGEPQGQRGGLDAHRAVVDRRHLDGVLVAHRDLQPRCQRGERREAAPAAAAPPACPRRAACPPPRPAARRRRSG